MSDIDYAKAMGALLEAVTAYMRQVNAAFDAWANSVDCHPADIGLAIESWGMPPKPRRNANRPRSEKRNAWRRRNCGRKAKHHVKCACNVTCSANGDGSMSWAPRILKRRMMEERRRTP